jgi:hypothetical protein
MATWQGDRVLLLLLGVTMSRKDHPCCRKTKMMEEMETNMAVIAMMAM